MKKVAIITGASSGMGKSTAFELHQKGYKVYGMARRTEKMDCGLPKISTVLK